MANVVAQHNPILSAIKNISLESAFVSGGHGVKMLPVNMMVSIFICFCVVL